MRAVVSVRLILIFATCASLFCLPCVFGQSQYDSSTTFAKYALKLPEDALRKLEAPFTRRTFSGTGTGYESDSHYPGGAANVDYTGYASMNGPRVLMVGDSMTVGGFGEAMQDYLVRRFGPNHVAIYASCGSSPEHWLRSSPSFITQCGYREQTPRSSVLYDFQDGKRPKPVSTPKLEDLVSKLHPTTVIVQLGTNWMDGMELESASDQLIHSRILDRFVAAARSEPNMVRKIIWIIPPDASRYSREVKLSVKSVIRAAAQRDAFATIDSNSMTHYVPGRSGSDGVHYNIKEAKQWAYGVMRELDRLLR
jgi:hypothetical protein